MIEDNDFVKLQYEIYETYQELGEAEKNRDKNKFNDLISKLKSQLYKQSEFLNNVIFMRKYRQLLGKVITFAEALAAKSLSYNMEQLSEEDIKASMLCNAFGCRILNLYEGIILNDYERKLDDFLMKSTIRTIKRELKTEKDVKKRDDLRTVIYILTYENQYLEKDFLENPNFLGCEDENLSYEIIDISSRKEPIKEIIIEYVEIFLNINSKHNPYITYLSTYFKVFLKTYMSFLSIDERVEVREKARKVINKYVGKLPQMKINELLKVIESKPKSNAVLRLVKNDI